MLWLTFKISFYLLFMLCILLIVEPGESSDSGLESWAIALIVAIPIVAFVVMLSIGVICALQRRSLFKDPGEVPAENNAANYRSQHEQQLLSQWVMMMHKT